MQDDIDDDYCYDRMPWGCSLPTSRYYEGERHNQSLARHEHYLALKMQLRQGMRVLEVGCAGDGRAAREIAIISDARVVCLSDSVSQVHRARHDTERAGLQGQVEFVEEDYMDLVRRFGENSFDAVYAIGATCYASSWKDIYDQIKKVLKPGGVFGVYEWCMTDAWNPSILSHRELAHKIEFGNYIPELRPLRDSHQAFIDVGFDIEHEEDLAERPDVIPWYGPFDYDFRKAQTLWNKCFMWLWNCDFAVDTSYRLCEMIGVQPKGTLGLFKRRKLGIETLVMAGQRKLFTPMYLVIARKALE